jgi:hypothetical protein
LSKLALEDSQLGQHPARCERAIRHPEAVERLAEWPFRREIGPAPAGGESVGNLDSIREAPGGVVFAELGFSSVFNDLTRPSCESAR